MLFGLNNIYYDKNSFYPFEKILERKYLEEIFINLKNNFSDFDNYDFIIYTQQHTHVLPDLINKKGNKILFYLSDERNLYFPDELINNFNFIFKFHLNKKLFNNISNLHFIPLGYNRFIPKYNINSIEKRKYDVFFSGNLNSNRIEFFKELQKEYYKTINSYINFTEGFSKGLPPEEYADVLNNSKIVLSPHGFITPDCFRTYEALRQGCIVITDKLFDEDIFNNSPIIQIKDWSNLSGIINYILTNKDFQEKIVDEQYRYYNKYLSGYGVSNYIMDIINR